MRHASCVTASPRSPRAFGVLAWGAAALCCRLPLSGGLPAVLSAVSWPSLVLDLPHLHDLVCLLCTGALAPGHAVPRLMHQQALQKHLPLLLSPWNKMDTVWQAVKVIPFRRKRCAVAG